MAVTAMSMLNAGYMHSLHPCSCEEGGKDGVGVFNKTKDPSTIIYIKGLLLMWIEAHHMQLRACAWWLEAGCCLYDEHQLTL